MFPPPIILTGEKNVNHEEVEKKNVIALYAYCLQAINSISLLLTCHKSVYSPEAKQPTVPRFHQIHNHYHKQSNKGSQARSCRGTLPINPDIQGHSHTLSVYP